MQQSGWMDGWNTIEVKSNCLKRRPTIFHYPLKSVTFSKYGFKRKISQSDNALGFDRVDLFPQLVDLLVYVNANFNEAFELVVRWAELNDVREVDFVAPYP